MYVLLLFCSSITGILTINFTDIQTGGRYGGSCTAALFLKPFAEGIEAKDGQKPAMQWAHLDIAGSMEVRASVTFTLVVFIFVLSLTLLFSPTNRQQDRTHTRRRA